jgi:VCBS repeat protein
MPRYVPVVICLAAIALTVPAQAQEPQPTPSAPAATATASEKIPDGGMPTFLRPETPKQRMERIGTAEDPGIDPDLEKVYWRFGKAYQIHKYDRFWAVYSPDRPDLNMIRPMGFVNTYRELYQHNEKWTWVWQEVSLGGEEPAPPPDLTKSTQSGRRYSQSEIDYFNYIRPEYSPLMPSDSDGIVRFKESSNGLPQQGSWRNSLDVADMDGDGHPDIVAPAQRAGGMAPSIFLGDGKGNWKFRETLWPHPTDYGSVAAADFNKDGVMDLVFGVHLQGIFVYLGDGKGSFDEATEGLPRDFGTRRVVITDVDRDGYPDIASISEGPTAVHQSRGPAARLRVYLNRNKGMSWELLPIADDTKRVAGDWLTIGNFNGDRYSDFAGASIYYNSVDTLFLSKGEKKWEVVGSGDGKIVPIVSYYQASAAGRFSSKKVDDVVMSYVRVWPSDLNPKLIPPPESMHVTGLDRVKFTSKGPVRSPIARWNGQYAITGVAAGDFNGDGHDDIISTHFVSGEERNVTLLLGDGKGKFTRAKLEGLTLRPRPTYDLKVADVNGDKRPDLIVMYEAAESSPFGFRDGSIQVFLNDGSSRTTVASGR